MFSKVIKGVLLSTTVGVGITYLYQRSTNNTTLPMETLETEQKKSFVTTQTSALAQKKLSAYRPDDWTNLHYAVEVYHNNGGKVLTEKGWELVRTTPINKEDGYFGAAYRDNQNKHVIIAHRGTEDLKDWMADFDMITRRLIDQQVSAWDFSKEVINLEAHGPDYTYSFTGHSLGGWLAETCLLKYQDEFVKEKNYPDAFSVTLDDPGGKEVLEALQPRSATNYKIALDKLDRTNYVSRPHTINTALGREGSTVYALVPDIEGQDSWLMKNTLLYTYRMHSSERLLKEFDEQLGIPKQCYYVIDWPRVLWGQPVSSTDKQKGVLGYLAQAIKARLTGEIKRGEYVGFYTYSPDGVNHADTLDFAAQFRLQHGVHYRVKPFDSQVLPLRNMSPVVRQFLENLNKTTNKVQILNYLQPNIVSSELAGMLNEYKINEREELVLSNPKISARTFRQKIQAFLSEHPELYRNEFTELLTSHFLEDVETLKKGGVPQILLNLDEQSKQTKDLLYRLSFEQGISQLYKFVKPSLEKITEVKAEKHAIERQLEAIRSSKRNIGTISLDAEVKAEIINKLEREESHLEIAEQTAQTLLAYLEDDLPKTSQQLTQLMAALKERKTEGLDQNLLLNRAYNLKAKVEARLKQEALSEADYKEATTLLPNDPITWSNYQGLLTDWGQRQMKQNPVEGARLYKAAYDCYQEVVPRLGQIKPEQLPVVCSSMAYSLILLAQSIEQKKMEGSKFPNILALRQQAQELLKRAVDVKPDYLNARLFSAVLAYDQGHYAIALQEVNNALSIDWMHPTALRRKGFILDKLGRTEEALEILGQARARLEKTQKRGENESWIKEVDEKVLEIQERRRKISLKY